MIKFLKKLIKKTPLKTCKHFRKCGDKVLYNMVDIIRFNDRWSKSSDFSYGVSECTECGKRAFACIGYHLITSDITRKIDAFIRYERSLDELTELFDKKQMRYEIKGKNNG